MASGPGNIYIYMCMAPGFLAKLPYPHHAAMPPSVCHLACHGAYSTRQILNLCGSKPHLFGGKKTHNT